MPPHATEPETDIVDHTGKKLSASEIQRCVDEIKELVKADRLLKRTRTDDRYMLRFLHCTGFKVSEAFERMKELCDLWIEHPDWFAQGGPACQKEHLDQGFKCILNERDKSGRRIFMVKLSKIDPVKVSLEEWARSDDLWLETVLDEPETQCNGVSSIIDIENISWKILKWLSPGNMKIGSRKADLMPINNLLIHIVGNSLLIHTAIKLLFPFLSQKTKDQVKFHFTDWASLHEYISPEVLPPEYGGTGPKIDYKKQTEWLFEQSEDIKQKLKYRDSDLNLIK